MRKALWLVASVGVCSLACGPATNDRPDTDGGARDGRGDAGGDGGAVRDAAGVSDVKDSGAPPLHPECTNIPGITKTTYAEHDLANGPVNYDPGFNGLFPMTGDEAVVIVFKTPNRVSSNPGIISGGPYLQNGESKLFVLGTAPCARYGDPSVLASGWGGAISIGWGLGGGVQPVLQPDTDYYLTITNRMFFKNAWIPSCLQASCPTKIQIVPP